ncbi:hypothetical protein IWX49DRAFT_645000 [Phyllosticta citricarpa]|uniref:Uncharacterized protein n=1 Tax=Phyllosticta citricarpa TaxID=55181 RepID=A0ABR1MDZ5_9PEZI
MISGPDLITYISVPLTLTGVVQIYILCKAIWIFYKLYRSVPNNLRSFYSFYPDPSSGTVLVIAPTIVCTNPGLWQETTPPKFYQVDMQKLRRRGFWRLWGRQKKDEPVLPTVQDWDEKKLNRCQFMPSWMTSQTKISLEPKRFHVSEAKDLFRPWMETATRLGFRLNQAKDLTRGEFHKWAKDMRITVGIDMGITPQKLAIPWKIFVWFALAIGTNPFDLDPQKERSKFQHITKHEVLMRLSQVGDDWDFALDTDQYYEYSVRRALALVNVMCFEHNNGTVVCRFLGSPDEFKLTPDFFRRPDHFMSQKTWLKSTDGLDDRDSSVGRLQAAALTWIFYEEHLAGQPLHKCGSDLLVCQWMLEAQQRSLLFLFNLDRAGTLETRLTELFRENSGEVSASSVQELLKILRDDFHSSAYLTKSFEFVDAVTKTVQRLGVVRQQSSSTDNNGASPAAAEAIQHLLDAWNKPLNPPPRSTTSSPFITYSQIQNAIQQISTRRGLLSEIVRCSPFTELREMYDPHDALSSRGAVENERLPAGHLALLAHVYLAIQPWQDHRRTAWEVSRRIREPLEAVRNDDDDGYDDNNENTEFDFANAVEALQRVAEEAKRCGIYSAPWESDTVYELLMSEDVPQVVFLV